MNDIVKCKCGSDNYKITQKANNHMAYCNDCGAFIKNVPYSEPTLYFGKYKGIPIKEIEDGPYLDWALKTLKLSANMRQAIADKIQALQLTHR